MKTVTMSLLEFDGMRDEIRDQKDQIERIENAVKRCTKFKDLKDLFEDNARVYRLDQEIALHRLMRSAR